ncbi:sulfite oxidase-like oxidoreductase [Williamsia sterculiae]|uniref:DMSO/TMAO reductase YedYZ, molybdopterin-dependent catalytic subunit n=1 Tax=Williamsia sterculiae TaxID=1344003 RepID=A0A1N7CG83_9NOCA|nr:sulfite oxidase-like oxidoreductase [Williamsia sterculiae]SIR62444.1 DMSO/TMAO reductase YedYZ, molybdopterin-dependent catalytic subunit [Williamsia sterculiae]
MAVINRRFRGKRRDYAPGLPPGQYLTTDFPVLATGPTPVVNTDRWSMSVTTPDGLGTRWRWTEFLALPQQQMTVDIHCVTRWSKLGTTWTGVSIDTLLAAAGVEGTGGYVMAHAFGGYTTNIPVADLVDGRAMVAHTFDGRPLPPEHGGPARLLVPHLYFWKSAKWVSELHLMDTDEPGFWERGGYHMFGDPWREQRYA